MAINFPSNPTTGDIFVFNQKKWRWNGYAWDRHPTADLDDQTGILYGGQLSANIGGSTFSVAGGIGQFIGWTANQYGAFPTLTEVTWGDITGATLNYLATSDFTRLYIDENGNLQQQTAEFDHTDSRTRLIIGTLSHIDRATIRLVTNKQHTAYAPQHRVYELFDTFGPIKKSGMNISANGANLSLNVSAGEALVIGLNYPNDFNEPDHIDYVAQTPADIARIYRDGSGDFIYDTNSFAFYTVVDGSKYDDNSGTLQTVNNNQWTIQRLYVFPNLQNVVMSYYGTVIYNSYDDALAGVGDEEFSESTITSNNAVFLGYLVLRGGAADLSSISDAHFLQSGFCRVSGGGGGGGGGGAGADGPTGPTGPAGYSIGFTAGNTAPVGSGTGDFWLETDTGLYYAYVWDGSTLGWLQISGPRGATGATPTEYVSSYNGATGAIEKIYGCFYNSSATEFTSLTTIGVDSVMYNSDPSGLTLSSDRIQINKNGVFKVTFDISCGLTGGLPGTALQSKFDVYRKRGIFSPTVVNGTSAYHEMPRANPAGSLQFTDTSSISMITPDHVSGDLYLVQGDLDVGTIGSGIFHVPANGYRITVEEL